jgi:hypothetical protein
MFSKYAAHYDEFLTPSHPPEWSITPCQLSVAAHTMYLQLLLLLHVQPEVATCRSGSGFRYGMKE